MSLLYSTNNWNVRRLALTVLMFHLVCVGWILFRASNLEQATGMLGKIVGDPSWLQLKSYPDKFALAWTGLGQMLLFAGPLLLLEFWIERSNNMLALLHVHWIWRSLAYSYFVLMLLFFPPVVKHEFIYFQF
jgi:alginate O-acetyltransferase complex protein AlgI